MRESFENTVGAALRQSSSVSNNDLRWQLELHSGTHGHSSKRNHCEFINYRLFTSNKIHCFNLECRDITTNKEICTHFKFALVDFSIRSCCKIELKQTSYI